jgi:hypothetical protein
MQENDARRLDHHTLEALRERAGRDPRDMDTQDLQASQRPRPALKATINFIAVTDETAPPNIAAITTITVLNSGEMQSVAGGISLRTVIDGKTYIGVPAIVPEKLSVKDR